MAKRKTGWLKLAIIGVVILVILNGIFLIPFGFVKYSLGTDKVQYNAQESYQETVNYDNCDSSYGCSCTTHGGLLWMTCTQCSCSRERTAIRERMVLKETTTESSATLYQDWTHSKVSADEARNSAQVLASFLSQKGILSFSITDTSKEGSFWVVKLTQQNSQQYNILAYVDTNNGRLTYLKSDNGQKEAFDITSINNQFGS